MIADRLAAAMTAAGHAGAARVHLGGNVEGVTLVSPAGAALLVTDHLSGFGFAVGRYATVDLEGEPIAEAAATGATLDRVVRRLGAPEI